MNPTRRQQKELAKVLKDFAFEQSPMFQQNHVQSMKVTQEFTYFDQPALPPELDETYLRDRTTIELGFRATRIVQPGFPTHYYYEISTIGSNSIHPKELKKRLSHDAWVHLQDTYGDPEFIYDTDGESQEGQQAREELQDIMIEEMCDEGVDCEVYQGQTLSYSTAEETIESSYERGFSINNATYDVLSSHDFHSLDETTEFIQTPEGGFWAPIRHHGPDGPLDITEEIAIDAQFDQIVGDIDNDDRLSLDLFSYDDKLREVLHVVRCLRNRSL